MAGPPRGPRSTRRAISATEAAKAFGSLVDRVRDERVAYVIERGGTAVAQIAPASTAPCSVADLVAVLRSRQRMDEQYLEEVEKGVRAWNRPAVPGR